MKKIIAIIFVCLAFVSCSERDKETINYDNTTEYKNAYNNAPPDISNFKATKMKYWFTFTRNNVNYLMYYRWGGGYQGECLFIMEDKTVLNNVITLPDNNSIKYDSVIVTSENNRYFVSGKYSLNNETEIRFKEILLDSKTNYETARDIFIKSIVKENFRYNYVEGKYIK